MYDLGYTKNLKKYIKSLNDEEKENQCSTGKGILETSLAAKKHARDPQHDCHTL